MLTQDQSHFEAQQVNAVYFGPLYFEAKLNHYVKKIKSFYFTK